ncbi:MAG TPA: hypothetical protein VKB70_03255 [Gaiellaceae bacterium]|nr:hypothetical protein [Gaiellaceae bacterium]
MRCLLAFLVVALGLAVLPTLAVARPGSHFPCTWNYDLYDGLRADYVTAGDNATCAGLSGSLTLSTRLQEWDVTTHEWRTVEFRRRTWTNIDGRRYTEAAKKCDGGRFRAKFGWLLRSGGRIAGHLSLTEGPINAPVGCMITLK